MATLEQVQGRDERKRSRGGYVKKNLKRQCRYPDGEKASEGLRGNQGNQGKETVGQSQENCTAEERATDGKNHPACQQEI